MNVPSQTELAERSARWHIQTLRNEVISLRQEMKELELRFIALRAALFDNDVIAIELARLRHAHEE